MATVAIIGGGFSGAAVAWHLRAKSPAADIAIIEPQADLGRGLAYSTTDPAHRINVPAARMNLDADAVDDYQSWIVDKNYLADDPAAELAGQRFYPSRHSFGTYVGERIRSLMPVVRHLQTSAIDVEPIDGRFHISCENGEIIPADIVVLAVCHAPPETPRSLRLLDKHPRFILNPWKAEALSSIKSNDRVLIVGTGLTMADITASLDRRGHRGEITAVSRRGLRSQPHSGNDVEFNGDFLSPPPKRASELVQRVRRAIAKAARDGIPWQSVIYRVHKQAQDIWQGLPQQERLRVLRHLRPYWDTHRFRIAPQLYDVLERRIAEGTLTFASAAVRAGEQASKDITVELRARGEQAWRSSTFDTVVLATGPGHASVTHTNPLLSHLEKRGLVQADVYGLGLAVDGDGYAIGKTDAHADKLFIAGPLARGTFGELMGISELAAYAAKIATGISTKL